MQKIDDGMIDYDEFKMALFGDADNPKNDTEFTKQIFKSFDFNEDGAINFWEFLIGFATYNNDTVDKQIESAFKIMCPEGVQGKITAETLKPLLWDAVQMDTNC